METASMRDTLECWILPCSRATSTIAAITPRPRIDIANGGMPPPRIATVARSKANATPIGQTMSGMPASFYAGLDVTDAGAQASAFLGRDLAKRRLGSGEAGNRHAVGRT
jgi:hypothetical protein